MPETWLSGEDIPPHRGKCGQLSIIAEDVLMGKISCGLTSTLQHVTPTVVIYTTGIYSAGQIINIAANVERGGPGERF